MYLRYYLTALVVCSIGVLILLTTNLMSLVSNYFSPKLEYKIEHSPAMTNVCVNKTDAESLASSVWCTLRLDGTRLCNFKNLFYLPQHKEYLLFFLNEHSVVSGVESSKTLKQITLSSIQNHPGFYLKLMIIKSSEYFLEQNFTYFSNHALIFKRFKPDNILHIIHDDLLPLFITFQELCIGDISYCLSKYQLIFLDDNDKGPFNDWYKHFSNYKPILLTQQNHAVCIQKSVIGLSRESIWFQYGFKSVHGPLLHSNISGLCLRQFSEFLKKQFRIKQEIRSIDSQDLIPIVFLSRKINRKILNEYTAEKHIKEIFRSIYNKPARVLNMDISTNSSRDLISSLVNSNFLIGMHGSAMILAMFLPPGSRIIEIFPFGIQPEFVSPLKALCSLPQTFYTYHAWVNTNKSNSRPHPEYTALQGGLHHLPPAEQEKIMNTEVVPPVECCHNPVYLFRMFQDTFVDDSFYDLLHTVLVNNTAVGDQECKSKAQANIFARWYFPPPVFNLTCQLTGNIMKIEWDYPFKSLSNVQFDVVTSIGVSAVTELTTLNIEIKEQQKQVSVWVKTLDGLQDSIDSYTSCKTR